MAKGQREVEERNDTGLLSLMKRLLRIYGKKSGERQHSIKIILLRVKGRPDPFDFSIKIILLRVKGRPDPFDFLQGKGLNYE